jgi:hypothetical protein
LSWSATASPLRLPRVVCERLAIARSRESTFVTPCQSIAITVIGNRPVPEAARRSPGCETKLPISWTGYGYVAFMTTA